MPKPPPYPLNLPVLLVKGVRAMLGSKTAVASLADADHEVELSRNQQLRAESPARQAESLIEIQATVSKRATLLRGVLVKSFLSMASATTLAYLVSVSKVGLQASGSLLAVFSAFCFAWATLGRLGWSGQSNKGDTSIERVDQMLFHALYWLGMYFAASAVL
jgi:hypothetical protein